MFDWNQRTYIMAIVNLTEDSFSGDGLVNKGTDSIIKKIDEYIKLGADIIDIGAESTKPGSSPINENKEIERLIPIITAVKERFNTTLSIDTYRANTAQEALINGADWINDVSGVKNLEMLSVLKEYDCPTVIMHNSTQNDSIIKDKKLGSSFLNSTHTNVTQEVIDELKILAAEYLDYGIKKENLIIDPGLGFGKTVSDNLSLIKNLSRLKEISLPILIGASRKSFIGHTLDADPTKRLTGTIATNAISILNGANILRVHDIEEAQQTAIMTDAILRN